LFATTDVPVPDNKPNNLVMMKYASILRTELDGDNNEKKESYDCTEFVQQSEYGNGNTKIIIDDVHYGKRQFRIVVKDGNQETMITAKKSHTWCMDVSVSTMWMGDGISQSIACGFGNKSGYGTDFCYQRMMVNIMDH
jgi:hypothetical protein